MGAVEHWTAPGSGGVAVVVLRGVSARARLARLGVKWEPEPSVSPLAGPRFVRLSAAGEELDEALLLRHQNGDIEVHLHGSPPLVERVLSILRLATDELSQAPPPSLSERAWRAMANARSELGARILLDQAEGAFEREVSRLRRLAAPELGARVSALLELGRRARYLIEPTNIALCGPVNAGKSTLFNLLVGSERTLVSPEQGTTRDAIAEEARLGPWPVQLVDTAGRRDLSGGAAGTESDVDVERAGQHLAGLVSRQADWSLELRRASSHGAVQLAAGDPASSVLWTCCDEVGSDPSTWPTPGVSAREKPGGAVARVRSLFEAQFSLPGTLDALWQQGRAVPFEPAQMETLRALHGDACGDRGILPGESHPSTGIEDLLR